MGEISQPEREPTFKKIGVYALEKEYAAIMLPREIEATAAALVEVGWEEFFAFHEKIAEQQKMALEKMKRETKYGDWDVALVDGQTDDERSDTIKYLYRRKTAQLKQYEEKSQKERYK